MLVINVSAIPSQPAWRNPRSKGEGLLLRAPPGGTVVGLASAETAARLIAAHPQRGQQLQMILASQTFKGMTVSPQADQRGWLHNH